MVIGYTILINQLVFHFLDVYIPMLHPLFFRRSSQVFRGSYRPDRLHRKPRGTYAAVQHQLGSQARCGAQWMLWISLENIRWRGRKNIFFLENIRNTLEDLGIFHHPTLVFEASTKVTSPSLWFFFGPSKGPYLAVCCFWMLLGW